MQNNNKFVFFKTEFSNFRALKNCVCRFESTLERIDVCFGKEIGDGGSTVFS